MGGRGRDSSQQHSRGPGLRDRVCRRALSFIFLFFIYFFLLFFCFNVSIVDLQCCIRIWYTTKWFSYTKHVGALSCVQFFMTPWTVAHQAPLAMDFSRQGYWSGLLFSSPGDLPNPGIKHMAPASPALQTDSLHCAPWKDPVIHM